MNNIKKVFISQPMKDLSDKKILTRREEAFKKLKGYMGEEYELELLDSFIKEDPSNDIKNTPLWYLAKSIEVMAEADIAYFLTGFSEARGCLLESLAAINYEIEIIMEDEITKGGQ